MHVADKDRFCSSKEDRDDIIGEKGHVLMPSAFWDVKRVLLIDQREKDKTITEQYYSNILRKL